MEKVILAIQHGHRNTENGWVVETIPNGWPSDPDKIILFIEQNKSVNNWSMIREVKDFLDVYEKTTRGELSSLFTHPFRFSVTYGKTNLVEVKLLSELSPDEKYIFPLCVWGSAWLEVGLFKQEGLHISEKVINDARSGRCKILLHEFTEGHGFNETWVKEFISIQCQKFQLPFEAFGFADSSYKTIELQKKYNTTGFFMPWWESHSPPLSEVEVLERIQFLKKPTIRPHYFISLNRRIRLHRSILVYNIFKRWSDKSLWSYDKPIINVDMFDNFNSPYHGMDDKLIVQGLLTRDIYNQLPKIIDVGPEVNDTTLKFDLLNSAYINLTTETMFFETETLFFSEKIFKPLLALQPFILLGNYQSLKLLKELGYKTFHPFIDETYDEIENPDARINSILAEIDRISRFTTEEMHQFIIDVGDICLHNYFHIMNSRKTFLREQQFLQQLLIWQNT